MKMKRSISKYLLVLFALYIAINLITLTRFPFVHSDESWLSGLSRNILENKDYSVTESFFDLKDRYPHAIKILFHTIQIIFMQLMGYDIFTFRLISLLFGLLCIILMYKLSTLIFHSTHHAWIAAVLLAIDVQFIYASHFARQEIIILFILLLGLWYKFKHDSDYSVKHDMILGCIIGLSIGIHPNSFIISLPFGLIYLYEIFILKKRRINSLITLVSIVAGFAAVFVAISFYFDPNFISNYSKYGNEFEVFNPITSKLGEIKLFYQKLYYRVSGTYYTPNIKLQFFLFPITLIASVIKLIVSNDALKKKTKLISAILTLAAINIGIVLIGRFNQTSIVLIFPLFYILMIYVLEGISPFYKTAVTALLIVSISALTLMNYWEYRGNSYDKYLDQLAVEVQPGDETLGNLNMEYYFENGKLHDYRNLAYLQQKEMSFEDYIRKNKIEYILYSEELDLIYQLQPKWDGIYGPMSYYEEMKSFVKKNCQLVHQYTDPYYGIRIVRYIGMKGWQIKVYKVND
ncbi:MAG: 4-amino-4-deoxy-L-arabinose transferase [Clostridia bacterium]|jgi:4-amino-4-deoxy-L-arabinose transferase-like glycosyltransferase|nr:4-amino-4-deoxy-L-arabinose transferase [Clostridia bacterium]